MSQSLLYHAFGVREGYEYQKTEDVEGRVEFHLLCKEERLKCPQCGHALCPAAGQPMAAPPHGAESGSKEVVLVTPRCRAASARSAARPLMSPPFCQEPTRTTVFPLPDSSVELSHWMTLCEVAAVSHLGWDTVKEIVKSDLGRRTAAHPATGTCAPLQLDEFHVGRKGRFLTVVLDLESGQSLWVAKGRGVRRAAQVLLLCCAWHVRK